MDGHQHGAAHGDTDRVVLVTGGGNGLGAAYATAWAHRGAAVVVNNRHSGAGESSAARTVRALRSAGLRAVADEHAVDAPDAAAAIVDTAIGAYGRLDALILNAGVSGPLAPAAEVDEQTFQDVMRINFHANTALVRAALPHVTASGSGRILFVSSNAGLYGVGGRAAYAASKGALTAYALTLADELRDTGVGVNVLLPYAATSMTGARAAPDPPMPPELVAPAAIWLTSALCQITGEVWIAGGGGFRRAQAMEGHGGWHAMPTPEWLAENHAILSEMSGARSHTGAVAAFLAFCASCRDHRQATERQTDA